MNTRLENLVVSGLVAAAISVSISGATTVKPEPKATHGIGTAVIHDNRTGGPSITDRLAALTRRVDALQNSDATTRQNLRMIVNAINTTNQDVADLQNDAPCIGGGYQAAWDANGHLVANNDAVGPTNFIIPILCGEDTP